MSKKKTSPIWTIPTEQLRVVVAQNQSFSAILRGFNLCPENGGGRLRDLKKRLNLENIDYSHIHSSNKGKTISREQRPLEEILIKNSTYSRIHLKKRLIKDGLLKQICNICRQEPQWNGLSLVLVLDHKNGIRDDNRLNNLQLLCPNCNSQMPTFSGRNNQKTQVDHICTKCGAIRSRKSKSGMCYKCALKYLPRHRKVKNRPNHQELKQEISKLGFAGTGRKYGVSDNCVRKWLA